MEKKFGINWFQVYWQWLEARKLGIKIEYPIVIDGYKYSSEDDVLNAEPDRDMDPVGAMDLRSEKKWA